MSLRKESFWSTFLPRFSSYPYHRYYLSSQLIGWALLLVIHFIFTILLEKLSWPFVFFLIYLHFVGYLVTEIYREFLLSRRWLNLQFEQMLLRVVLASIVKGAIWLILQVIYLKLAGMEDASNSEYALLAYASLLFNTSIIFMTWNLLYFGYHFFKTYQLAELEKWKLEASVKEAEIIALKAQINPHFIFNSLNNIRGLVIENPQKARVMITHLSDLLRYSLQLSQFEKVSLAQEIEIVEHYLQLESIQFENRLQYHLNIDPQSMDLQIPPMVIQILVENAIKHGISHLPEGGVVQVNTRYKAKYLEIEVINSGQLNHLTDSTGLGLENASQRLKLLSKNIKGIELKNIGQDRVAARFSIALPEPLSPYNA